MSKCLTVLGFENVEDRVVLTGNWWGVHLDNVDDGISHNYTVESQEQKIALLLPAIQKIREIDADSSSTGLFNGETWFLDIQANGSLGNGEIVSDPGFGITKSG